MIDRSIISTSFYTHAPCTCVTKNINIFSSKSIKGCKAQNTDKKNNNNKKFNTMPLPSMLIALRFIMAVNTKSRLKKGCKKEIPAERLRCDR